MAVRDDRGDVKQTTTGFRGPLMVQSLTSAKSKFLSLRERRSSKEQQGTSAHCHRGDRPRRGDGRVRAKVCREAHGNEHAGG